MLSTKLLTTVHDYDYYVDSVNGSDANDGTSAATAFATISALDAVVSDGDRIGLARGSHFREQLTDFGSKTGITVAGYGTGNRPIIDGSRIIPAAAWTQDATYPNVYYADVTHEVETTPHATDSGDSNTFHIAVWEDDTLLTGVFGGVDIDANRSTVNSTPGSFTAHLSGSTDQDPRSGTGGTQYRYYVHLSDSGDPGSNDAVMAYAEQQATALLATGGTYRGLEFRRSATKDMVGMADGVGGFCAEVSDCVFRDPGCHGAVIRPAVLRNCYAYGRSDGRSMAAGGYGFNFFYGQPDVTYTPAITARNNVADGFSIGIGSHGSVSGPVHESVTLIDNSTPNCNTGVALAASVNGISIQRHTALNCTHAVRSLDDATTVSNLTYLSATAGDCTGLDLYANLTIEDSSLVFRSSVRNKLAANEYAQTRDEADHFVTLTLNRCSVKGGGVPDTNRRCQVDIVGEDCILGKLSNFAAARQYNSLTLTNSYVSERQRTVDEMEAANATLTDCLSPWELETQAVTVAADDISTEAIVRHCTSAGAGLTEVTMQIGDTPVVNAMRVPNWDGLGSAWDTYLLSNVSTTYTVSSAHQTPGAFSSKQAYYTRYNKTFDFGYPLRQYDATATQNGPGYTIADGPDVSLSGYQNNTLYRISMASPYRTTDGINASNTNPMVDAVNGIIDAGFHVVPGALLTVFAVCDKSNEDLVWQGDPDTTGIAIIDPSSRLYALGMGRQA